MSGREFYRRRGRWEWISCRCPRRGMTLPSRSNITKSPLLEPLLSLIRSDEFKRKVDALGGYDTTSTGQVAAEVNRGGGLMVCYASTEVPGMNDTDGVTGIVLAGGRSRRLGRDKAVETIAGQALIARVLDSLSHVADELVVVVNNREREEELPLPDSVVTAVDIYPDTGSLGGIFTGLSASSNEWGVVVACDMPFLNLELLEHLLSFRAGHDLVVPVVDHRPEPTHAAYSKVCLPAIETRLRRMTSRSQSSSTTCGPST